MNDNDFGLALERLVAERKRIGPSPALQQAVWAIPATTPPERRRLPRIDTRRFSMFSALKFAAAAAIVALFGGLLLSGILTAPQEGEVPPAAVTESPAAEATSEILFELAVPGRAFLDGLTALEAGDWTLLAGTDVTGEEHTSQAHGMMRARAFMVTSGSFLIEPTTEALLWRTPGATPETVPAGEAVTLQPGEAIYLPAVPADKIDPERYLRVANPGADDATGLTFHVTDSAFGGDRPAFPPGLRWETWPGTLVALEPFAADWNAAEEALFRLTRHQADPGTAFDLTESSAAPATSIVMVESGALEQIVNGPGGEFRSVWRSGSKHSFQAAEGIETTLTAMGDEPASFLQLVATPRSAVSAASE